MKHLLRGVALVALLAVFAPALAQSPDTASAPTSNGPAPAVQEKAAAHDAGAANWVQPPLAALRLALLLGPPLDVAGRPRCQRSQLGYRVRQRLGLGRLGPLRPDALHLLLRRRAQVSPAVRLMGPPTWLNHELTITLR